MCKEGILEARELLRANNVEIGLDDNRSAQQIICDLGLCRSAVEKVEVSEQISESMVPKI